MTAQSPERLTGETDPRFDHFSIHGADILQYRTWELKETGRPFVVLMTGQAATGKTLGSLLAHEIIDISLNTSQNTISSAYRSKTKPFQNNPPIENFISKSIIDTDFFFHQRDSEKRKLPFQHWMRHEELFNTFEQLSGAIVSGHDHIPVNRLYDRKSGVLRFTDEPALFPVRSPIIITGLYAFRYEPYLQKYGIPYLRILLLAQQEEIERRFIERNASRKPLSVILHHLHDELGPVWNSLRAEFNDVDLLWTSRPNNEGVNIHTLRSKSSKPLASLDF